MPNAESMFHRAGIAADLSQSVMIMISTEKETV